MEINVKLKDRTPDSARAVVCVDFSDGGFTTTVFVKIVNGKPKFTVPLDRRKHPALTLRGELKQRIFAAVWDSFDSGEAKRPDGAEAVS